MSDKLQLSCGSKQRVEKTISELILNPILVSKSVEGVNDKLKFVGHHWHLYFLLTRSLLCFLIPCINVSRNSETRIIGQYSVESFRCVNGSVRYLDLAGMSRIADTTSAPMLKL